MDIPPRNKPMITLSRFMPGRAWLGSLIVAVAGSAFALTVDMAKVATDSAVHITVLPETVIVEWPSDAAGRLASATFCLTNGRPLIASLALAAGGDARPQVIARDLEPFTAITVGSRDLATPAGWMLFFDKVNTRPSQRYAAKLSLSSAVATAQGNRGSLELGALTAGPFAGKLVFTFYAGSPLIQAEVVVSTTNDACAIVYDAGLVAPAGSVKRFTWIEPGGNLEKSCGPGAPAVSRRARFRTVLAETAEQGTVAVFPPPHRFFYPLDFAENFGFNWCGQNYKSAPGGDGWGVCQPPEGDRRWVPWVNAPPNTMQRFGAFYLLGRGDSAATLAAVKAFTHDDHFVPVPGCKTFTSHYHLEHTLTLLKAQKAAGSTNLPANQVLPGFVRAFREAGVDIVHLAEFHQGNTPKLTEAPRLLNLRTLHAECARLSNDKFLLLPGEEPNVHLGGHWISLFPKPVLWVLNRPGKTPFAQTNAAGEIIYHVGNAADVLELMEREQGLMWTAHARIKGSFGYPDNYRAQAFFRSPQFLGAAWKAMPADYSRDTLGWRVLDTLDDMNNWGADKQAIGEVDVFKVEPDYELYGHMNINYVELSPMPKFADGWSALLAALRAGKFFTTTGEILLTDFSATKTSAGQVPSVRAHLSWTFPLSHAEVVGGDGQKIYRQRIDLSQTRAYGQLDLVPKLPAEFAACHWLRLEVWDVAADGAFTQPVHLDSLDASPRARL